MNSETISCKVITPMFSYGGNSTNPELRPTELKGLMRYVYRITQQSLNNKELFAKESTLFGSTEFPSPIRLQMVLKGCPPLDKKQSMTLHRQQPDWLKLHPNKKDEQKNCIIIDTTFDITLVYRKCQESTKNIYNDILRLSLYISGMGKRTRRARGCVCIEGEEKSVQGTKEDILNLLNLVSGYNEDGEVKTHYIYDELCIKPVKSHDELRPIIQKICFGQPFPLNNLNRFLLAVDNAGHTTKDETKAKDNDPTGTGRRASSIIVSVVKTAEGYLPIYTYVKAIKIYDQKEPEPEDDKNCEKRKEFQNKIETRIKNGGK